MNVSPGHILYPLYRLWLYLLTKSFVPIWFVEANDRCGYDREQRFRPERFIPTSLCPFINRLVLYFVWQVPVMFVAGMLIAFFFIYTQIEFLMVWYITGSLHAVFALCDLAIPGGMFFAVTLIGIVIAMSTIVGAVLEVNEDKKWAKFTLDVVSAVNESPALFFKPVFYPFRIFKMWYQARHDKFCPSLSFEQKATSEKQE